MTQKAYVPRRQQKLLQTGFETYFDGNPGSIIGSAGVRFDKERRRIEIARADTFGARKGLFRLRVNRRWVDTPNHTPLYFTRAELADLLAALLIGDDQSLPATYPDLRWIKNTGPQGDGLETRQEPAYRTASANLRNRKVCGVPAKTRERILNAARHAEAEQFGAISIRTRTRKSLKLAPAEAYGGGEGLFRVRIDRIWTKRADGSPEYCTRKRIAKLIGAMLVGSDASGPTAENAAGAGDMAVKDTRAAARRGKYAKHTPVAELLPSTPQHRAGAFRSARSVHDGADANYGRTKKRGDWTPAWCPYTSDTERLRLEGGYTPDPYAGF
jgi:hypothetical protein